MRHVAFRLVTALLSLAIAAGRFAPCVPAFHRYTNGAYLDSPEAFHGLGRLAFLKEKRIYVLDGETGMLQKVENSEGAEAMAWSPDGAWLAFLRDGALMLAAATQWTAQPVNLPGHVNGFAWSPVRNVLAVGLAPRYPAQNAPAANQATQSPYHLGSENHPMHLPELPAISANPKEAEPTGGSIWLVSDPAAPRAEPLLTLDRPVGAVAWSPDGETIAYVSTLPSEAEELRSDALEIVPAAGGEPARWHVADQAGIELAGWWPDGRGILFWSRPLHSSSIAADGLPLQSLAVGTAEPIGLPTMLLDTSWLSWNPSGTTLAMIAGEGRSVWDRKSLALCDPAAGECRTLPQSKEQVTLAAAWSPSGEQVAAVRAHRRSRAWTPASQEDLAAWVESRTLWMIDPEGKQIRKVGSAGSGIHSPAWSKDGRHLLYVKDGALWVLDLEEDQARRVVTLGTRDDQSGFTGAISWWSRMAWYKK